jgi:hypothetical protein
MSVVCRLASFPEHPNNAAGIMKPAGAGQGRFFEWDGVALNFPETAPPSLVFRSRFVAVSFLDGRILQGVTIHGSAWE